MARYVTICPGEHSSQSTVASGGATEVLIDAPGPMPERPSDASALIPKPISSNGNEGLRCRARSAVIETRTGRTLSGETAKVGGMIPASVACAKSVAASPKAMPISLQWNADIARAVRYGVKLGANLRLICRN